MNISDRTYPIPKTGIVIIISETSSKSCIPFYVFLKGIFRSLTMFRRGISLRRVYFARAALALAARAK